MFQRARGVSPAREREKKLNLQRAGSAEPLLSLTYAPGQPGVAMLPFPSLKGKSEMLYDICQGGSLVTGGHILPRICMTLGRRKGGPEVPSGWQLRVNSSPATADILFQDACAQSYPPLGFWWAGGRNSNARSLRRMRVGIAGGSSQKCVPFGPVFCVIVAPVKSAVMLAFYRGVASPGFPFQTQGAPIPAGHGEAPRPTLHWEGQRQEQQDLLQHKPRYAHVFWT